MSGAGDIPPLPSNPGEDESGKILGATLTVTSMALIVVLARLYVRNILIRNMGWDDAIMTFAMALALAGQGIVIAQTSYGAGKHMGDIDPTKISMGLKLNFISQPIYLFGICIVKLAVGASLLRIASTKGYKWTIIAIMGFMAFYTTGCFFTVIFQCTDIRILWDTTVTSVCWSQKTLQGLSYTNSSLNILTDLLFAIIIPAPMLWNLNVHIRTRISLIAILGLGVFVCAAAFVKLGYLVNYGKLGDWLWDSRNITIWTAVEMNIGIVAGSLPTLRPLFKRFLGSVYGKGSRKTPVNGAYYAHGTVKSGSHWRTLSSGGRRREEVMDDASSQEGFNATGRRDEYELGDGVGGPQGITVKSGVVTGIESKGSDESLVAVDPAHRGITKTTVTTINVHDTKN